MSLSRSPVSLSSSSATLLLFLFVSLPLPLPLIATPAPTPDQYDAATAHHHGHQLKLRSIKLQSSETLLPQQESRDGQLHSVKLQHSGYVPSESLLPLQTPQENDKLSFDYNEKDTRNVRSVDASQIHRVKLAKSGYQTGSLLPLQVSQLTRKESDQKKNDVPLSDLQSGSVVVKNTEKKTIHYEGDDDITIDEVKALDETLQGDYNSPLEELDINVEDNNVPHIYSNIRRAKRETQEETVRQKRDFIRWYGTSSYHSQIPQQSFISSYQLSSRVPYFVPIWGNPGRIPVFFPLRPILFNPGYPVANPPIPQPTQQPNFPFVGGSTENPPTGNVSIGNRINTEQDDNPVWGVVESEPNFIAPSINDGGVVQRPNTPSRKPQTPPLIHRPSRTDADDDDNVEPNPPPITQVQNELNPTRPQRPPQNTQQNFPQIPANNRDPLFEFANTQRPIFVPAPTTTRPPGISGFPGNNQVTNNPGRREPSRCVWAVISCCSPLSNNVRYSCFEQLGCNGSFWDGNPCSREYTTAALNAAQKFYEQTGTRR